MDITGIHSITPVDDLKVEAMSLAPSDEGSCRITLSVRDTFNGEAGTLSYHLPLHCINLNPTAALAIIAKASEET